VQLFDPPPKSENMTTCRRFSNGRVVVAYDTNDANVWLSRSELAVCGRAISAKVNVHLPLQRELILPEALDCDEDLHFGRPKPSKEQVAAQKGVTNKCVLITSGLAGMPLTEQHVVLVVSVTAFVEEDGEAVFQIRENTFQLPDSVTLPRHRLYYLGLHLWPGEKYAEARLKRMLSEAWLTGRLNTPIKVDSTPIELTDEELESIPGAKMAMHKMDGAQFDVLVKKGTSYQLKAEDISYWMAQGDGFSTEFAELKNHHDANYMHACVSVITGDNAYHDDDDDDDDAQGLICIKGAETEGTETADTKQKGTRDFENE
jgi:hypothetical protein